MKKTLLISTALLCTIPFITQAKPSCDDGKYYCKDMDNCADARYHLEQCGLDRLDRDNDGIPCESICGKGKKRR